MHRFLCRQICTVVLLCVACAPPLPFALRGGGNSGALWDFQTDWDDRVNFVENEYLYSVAGCQKGCWRRHLVWMWGVDGFRLGVYEPMSWLFKSLVVSVVGKLEAHIFFTISVMIHGFNAVLLSSLCFKTIRCVLQDRGTYRSNGNYGGLPPERLANADWIASAVAAGAYAIHPLRVETVGWLSCQSYLLASAAALLCLNFHALAFFGPGDDLQRTLTKVAAIVCFVIAILCKVTMTPLPALMVLLDVLLYDPRGTWNMHARNAPKTPLYVLPIAVLSSLRDHFVYFLASGGAIWRAYVANNSGMQPGSVEYGLRLVMAVPSYRKSLSMAERTVKGAATVAWYLTRTLWPFELAIFYPVASGFRASSLSTAFPAVFVFATTIGLAIGVLWASVVCNRRFYFDKANSATKMSVTSHTGRGSYAVWFVRMGALAWGSLVCTLLPTLGLVQHGWEIHGADRYSYLPSICMVPLYALALREAAIRLKLLASRRQMLFHSSCLVLMVVLGLKSNVSLRKWRSSEMLWKHAVTYGPSDAIAHYNMGCVLERYARDVGNDDATQKEEKRNLAMGMFTEALNIDSGYGAAHNNVGYLLEEMSSSYWQKSEQHYREAIRLNPGHYTAHNNLGRLMHRTSRLEEAEGQYRKALLLHPGYIIALYNIATLLHTTGGPSREIEAEAIYRKAISISTAGRPSSSRSHKIAEVYYNLAQMLGTRNGAADPELIGLLQKALEIRPSYNRAQRTLDSVRGKISAA